MPHKSYVVSWRRLFPTVKPQEIPSLAFSPENIDLNPVSLSLWSSPLSVAGLGLRVQALGSFHGPVWVEEMSCSHLFWELPQMPGDSALRKSMKEQHLPHQLQDAKHIFFSLETLHFGVLKGIYFSKNVQAVENHFLLRWKLCINIYKINCVHSWIYVYFKSL